MRKYLAGAIIFFTKQIVSCLNAFGCYNTSGNLGGLIFFFLNCLATNLIPDSLFPKRVCFNAQISPYQSFCPEPQS